MPNQKNQDTVKNLKEKLAKAKSVVLAEYHGLNANQVNELRAKLGEVDAEMIVTKNSLLQVAMKEQNLDAESLSESLKGPNAAFIGYEDAVAPIKALVEFAKEAELPVMKSGIVDGTYAGEAQLKVLSELPSKDELIAKVVGGLKSPLNGIVNVLKGNQRNFVYTISAIAEKKGNE